MRTTFEFGTHKTPGLAPLRIVVAGDCCCSGESNKPVRVDKDNFQQMLKAHAGELVFEVPNHLASHPGHEIAARQQAGFGAMISFELDAAEEEIPVFLQELQLFTLAESLGGVESLVAHPASMTHAAMSVEDQQAAGISRSLLRLSVGIEHVDDLLSDLDNAFEAIRRYRKKQAVRNVA